ncbi:hypothetical protein [Actinoplanes sp. NPDC048796]|uniref:LppU/SCO3897 family protein n=1 Tax=Actinoplanes sp. NPDC048796 TaxID=3155640 RepID=UPI0033DF3831
MSNPVPPFGGDYPPPGPGQPGYPPPRNHPGYPPAAAQGQPGYPPAAAQGQPGYPPAAAQGQPSYPPAGAQRQPGYPPAGGQHGYAPAGQPAYAPDGTQPGYQPAGYPPPGGQPGYPPPGGQPGYPPPGGQPGYPPAGGQPGFPPPNAGGYPPPNAGEAPPPLTPVPVEKKRGAGKLILRIGLALVAVVVFGIIKGGIVSALFGGDDAKEAKAGDCVSADTDIPEDKTERTRADVVDCASSDAAYSVVARVDGESDPKSTSCDKFFKEGERFLVLGSREDGGYLLCLRPAKA